MDANRRLGNNLRYYRKLRDLTLKEMSQKIGLSWSTYQKYETGLIKHVDIDMVKTFAKALDVEPSVLLDWGTNEELENLPKKILVADASLKFQPKNHQEQDIEKIRKSISEIEQYQMSKELEESKEALEMYHRYLQAPPNIQAAVEALLKKN